MTEKEVARYEARLESLKASFESEIRRVDQVIQMGEKGVNVAMVAAEKAVAAALAAADKATDKAEQNTQDSFDKVNEFRLALDDLGKQMATRREMEDFKKTFQVSHDSLQSLVNTSATRIERIEAAGMGSRQQRTDSRANFTLGQAAVGTMVAVFAAIALYLGVHNTQSPALKCYDVNHVQIICP